MNNLRIRPQSNYIQQASWKDLYDLTTYWLSELSFTGDELHFLNDLIGKYLILMTRQESILKVQQMVKELDRLTDQQKQLNGLVKKHLTHIEEWIEKGSAARQDGFREEHRQLEEKIVAFEEAFRRTKKEIFTITEHVIGSEKLHHLLGA